MFFPQDCFGSGFYLFNPDHSTDPEKGTMPPKAKVAKLKAEGSVGNA